MKKRVLLVIDMNKDFTQEGGALFFQAGDDIVANVNKVIAEFRKTNDLIIFVNDRHSEDDEEFKLFPPHCVEGTEGVEVNDSVDYQPEKDRLFFKETYNAFIGTGMVDFLLEEKRMTPHNTEVCVIGVCTSICIMETVADLYYGGYKTVVNRRCVADLTPEAHEGALVRMKTLFGTDITG